VIGERRILVVNQPQSGEHRQATLNVIDRSQRVLEPSQPKLLGLNDSAFDCRNWRSSATYLLEGTQGNGDVEGVRFFQVSTNPPVPYRLCEFVPTEQIHGHAVSPDGSIAVVITGVGDTGGSGDVMGPDYRVFLRRVELAFPEKPRERTPLLAPKNKYFAGARLAGVFAKRLAVSPDNTKLVIAYGVRTGDLHSNAVAFFGIYSLADGRRLATLEGDTFRNGLWQALLSGDSVPTRSAPIEGALLFSPDSREIYAGSKRTWHWNLAGLQ
jgi:hypothetical protein